MHTVTDNQQLSVSTNKTYSVLHPGLAAKMEDFRMRVSVHNCGYPVLTDWHPVIPEGWGEFPALDTERAVIYRGNAESWAYSHHHTITKFGDRYVVSWSNGFSHEDYVGQEVHCAWSKDGLNWSEPQVVVHTPVESGLVRNNAGVFATKDRVYCYVCAAKDFGRDSTPPGMMSLSPQKMPLEVYVSSDLENWECHENIVDDIYLFEGPRPMLSGKLMCCGYDVSDGHAMILFWDSPEKLAGPPKVVHVHPPKDGVLPTQGTWYETGDGRIYSFWRDDRISCRLGLCYSDDGGESWSDLLCTDFPNTFSRAFAGRLTDGRFYIVGNNYDVMLDRRTMLIALSDNGHVFDRQYTIVQGDTTRRVNGRHKEDGYHYPNCMVDGDKLFVVYSVNKEDIEVSVVDMSQVA